MTQPYAIAQGDVIEWCQKHVASRGEKFHAVLSDPPYCLDFMGMGQRDSPHRIYMAKNQAKVDMLSDLLGVAKWEAAAILWYKEVVLALVSVCYPNAIIALFCGARTLDLLAAGMRAAGCEVFDQVPMMYGSGMPHGQNLSLAIDAKLAALQLSEKEAKAASHNDDQVAPSVNVPSHAVLDRTPITDEAAASEGYFTQLAPGYESLLLARTPWQGTFVDSMLKFGTGGLNIDGIRIPVRDGQTWTRRGTTKPLANPDVFSFGFRSVDGIANPKGRYPKNIIAVHRNEVFWCSGCGKEQSDDTACGCTHTDAHWIRIPGCTCLGTAQVAGQKPTVRVPKEELKTGKFVYGKMKALPTMVGFGDEDGMETVENWQCIDHWVCGTCGHTTPYLLPTPNQTIPCRECGGAWHHIRCASRELDIQTLNTEDMQGTPLAKVLQYMQHVPGYEGSAARRFFYTAKSDGHQRNFGADRADDGTVQQPAYKRQYVSGDDGLALEPRFAPTDTHNPHPTLKNIFACMRFATMIAPPAMYKPRIFVPFSGVGSEVTATVLSGMYAFVQGVELDADEQHGGAYIPIARKRIEQWLELQRENPHLDIQSHARTVHTGREQRKRKVKQGQTSMDFE